MSGRLEMPSEWHHVMPISVKKGVCGKRRQHHSFEDELQNEQGYPAKCDFGILSYWMLWKPWERYHDFLIKNLRKYSFWMWNICERKLLNECVYVQMSSWYLQKWRLWTRLGYNCVYAIPSWSPHFSIITLCPIWNIQMRTQCYFPRFLISYLDAINRW